MCSARARFEILATSSSGKRQLIVQRCVPARGRPAPGLTPPRDKTLLPPAPYHRREILDQLPIEATYPATLYIEAHGRAYQACAFAHKLAIVDQKQVVQIRPN